MPHLRLAGSVLAALVLGGCAAGPHVARVEPIDGVVSGQCHLDMVRGAVGLAASDATVERARIDSDSTEVQVVGGAAERPADGSLPDTASAGGSRLTIETGDRNAITGMRCG